MDICTPYKVHGNGAIHIYICKGHKPVVEHIIDCSNQTVLVKMLWMVWQSQWDNLLCTILWCVVWLWNNENELVIHQLKYSLFNYDTPNNVRKSAFIKMDLRSTVDLYKVVLYDVYHICITYNWGPTCAICLFVMP